MTISRSSSRHSCSSWELHQRALEVGSRVRLRAHDGVAQREAGGDNSTQASEKVAMENLPLFSQSKMASSAAASMRVVSPFFDSL